MFNQSFIKKSLVDYPTDNTITPTIPAQKSFILDKSSNDSPKNNFTKSENCCNTLPTCEPIININKEISTIHDITYTCCPGTLSFYDINIPSSANDGDIIRILPSTKWGYGYYWYLLRLKNNNSTLHKLYKYKGELYLPNDTFDIIIEKGPYFFQSININLFELPTSTYVKQNDDTEWIPIHINNKYLLKTSSSGKVNIFYNNTLYTFKNMQLITF